MEKRMSHITMVDKKDTRDLKGPHEENGAIGTAGSYLKSQLAKRALFIALLAAFADPVAIDSQASPVQPAHEVPLMLRHLPTTHAQAGSTNETVTQVSRDDATDAGEPITYPDGGSPEVTSAILTVPPSGKTEWMTHPVPGYVYVLEGTLTVEFEDGHRLTFHSGQGFLQARTKWHRGINQGKEPLRFLAVFFGAKGVPIILHPPKPDPGATQR
jgi:quercetin dioxygenase-like cupin family protein